MQFMILKFNILLLENEQSIKNQNIIDEIFKKNQVSFLCSGNIVKNIFIILLIFELFREHLELPFCFEHSAMIWISGSLCKRLSARLALFRFIGLCLR